MMYQGVKMEDYLKYTGTTMEQLRESYQEQAKKSVKTRLVFEALIKQEKLEVTDEEYEQKVSSMSETAKKDVEEFKKGLPERQVEYIKNEIVIDKLFKLLRSLIRSRSKRSRLTKTRGNAHFREFCCLRRFFSSRGLKPAQKV